MSSSDNSNISSRLQLTNVSKALSPYEQMVLENNKSTLEQSQKKTERVVVMAGLPILPLPQFVLTIELFTDNSGSSPIQATLLDKRAIDGAILAMHVEQWEHEAIMKVLDSWSKSIREEAQHTKEAAEKRWREALTPEQQIELERRRIVGGSKNDSFDIDGFTRWVATRPAAEQQELLYLGSQCTLLEGMSKIINSYTAQGEVSSDGGKKRTLPPQEISAPVMAAAFVITGTNAGEWSPIVDVSSTELVSVTPLQSNMTDAMAIVSMPSDMRIEMEYIGALFAGAAQYVAAAETLQRMGKEEKKEPFDSLFAERYAENVLAIVNSSALDTAAMAILATKCEQGKPLSAQRKAELIAMVKVSLLTIALALCYKIEVGGNQARVTEQELEALLQGKMTLAETDAKVKLAAAISTLLQKKEIGEKKSQLLFEKLVSYVTSNPSVDQLADPVRVCLRLLDTSAIRGQATTQA